ncbi:cellulose biosynthesis protein BcsO [Edaphovirga cremea]|uniref:cellulose biosynthesis protein BcsO n=1 Tax=Edaphovirga cremea TaxID=2267246 RepID=UPI000DEF584A|nr:cellulose biosynthesis protein BcsO [Edaphovirga cremea]
MNNYDDIKRFKEKAKMERIDYKEIAENEDSSSMQGWAIIKQVSARDEAPQAFDNGRTTQPTPSPISSKEFDVSSFMNAVAGALPPQTPPPLSEQPAAKAAVVNASPLFQAVSAARPAQAPTAVNQIQTPPAPQPEHQVAGQAVDQGKLMSRYKNMFKQKVPQSAGTTADPLRDIPLQPLLEMIASCR